MLFHPIPFPPVPGDTARAAITLFGKGNAYIRLGEHVNELLSPLGPVTCGISGEKSIQANILHTMLVAFQFAEELTDRQMLEALRNRVDLKYALHLPMNYPAPPPNVLCECRKQLRADPASQQVFQILLDGIAGFGLLQSDRERPSSALEVIDEVCISNRLDMVAEAMLQALESLTATNAEWLRHAARPHWYVRYSRRTEMHLWPNNKEKWEEGVLAIGADIQYLLAEIDKSRLPVLTSLPEVQLLKQAWEEQFDEYVNGESRTKKVCWRLTRCASCSSNS
jgi:Transposase domain (DUF772)